MSFESLGLSSALTSAVREKGYAQPTPVQVQAIPAILEGRDIIAAAQTGTGKTAGFTLPLLHQLSKRAQQARVVRALIVTPTRELAAQIHESVETYGQNLPFKSCVVFGGVKINPQIARLKGRNEIVIATPGRLLDLVNQGALDLSHVEILVLDEADRMLDMGFIHDVKRILKLLPKQRQNLLFSATFSSEIKKLAGALLHNPKTIEVARRNTTAERVTQLIHPVDKARKRELLSFLIGSNNWKQVLVFTRTKHGANRLAKQLEIDGLTSAAIHGNKSQGARTRALANFKAGSIRVLVATDIAARGLDIDKLPHVVNYDLPNVPEDYVHRIGRTGRAANDGLAMSLVSADEMDFLRSIERLLKCKLPQEILKGYEPSKQATQAKPKNAGGKPAFKAKQNRSGRNRRRNSGSNTSGRKGKNSSRYSTSER